LTYLFGHSLAPPPAIAAIRQELLGRALHARPDDAEAGEGGGVDVHYSSGRANRAFSLLAAGLSCGGDAVESIGLAAARDIHYRALTTYLPETATYADMRDALVQAAIDLYGATSPAVDAVDRAYDIIGAPNAYLEIMPTCDRTFATTVKCAP
jgi:hypothetical protein